MSRGIEAAIKMTESGGYQQHYLDNNFLEIRFCVILQGT